MLLHNFDWEVCTAEVLTRFRQVPFSVLIATGSTQRVSIEFVRYAISIIGGNICADQTNCRRNVASDYPGGS